MYSKSDERLPPSGFKPSNPTSSRKIVIPTKVTSFDRPFSKPQTTKKMKTTTTIIAVCVIAALTFSLNTVNAQCNSPRLRFQNPTLVSGNALSQGAKYKFANVMAGVDCIIKVKDLNGGATLVAMETPDQGYNDAWQPVVKSPSSPLLNKSWITFEIEFQTTSGSNYTFPCLDVSAIDIDGDGVRIGEFVEAKDFNFAQLPVTSLLTATSITNSGQGTNNGQGAGLGTVLGMGNNNNDYSFQGPWTNRPSIDTSAEDVRVNFSYSNKNKFELKLGAFIYNNGNNGAVATDRLNCIYFSRITGSFALLPVSILSFTAAGNEKKVVLNWETENEVNHDHYEVERSFDNNDFKSIGLVMDAVSAAQNRNNYKFFDNSTALKGHKIAYYRLKEVSADNRATYSVVVAVKLGSEAGMSMQVGPNPFVNTINLSFKANENTVADVIISNIAGKTISTQKYNVSTGNNNIQVNNLGNLASGMYIVKVYVNGVAMDTQKLVKN